MLKFYGSIYQTSQLSLSLSLSVRSFKELVLLKTLSRVRRPSFPQGCFLFCSQVSWAAVLAVFTQLKRPKTFVVLCGIFKETRRGSLQHY